MRIARTRRVSAKNGQSFLKTCRSLRSGLRWWTREKATSGRLRAISLLSSASRQHKAEKSSQVFFPSFRCLVSNSRLIR